MNTLTLSRISRSIVVTVLTVASISAGALALAPTAAAEAGQAFSISPPLIELAAQPGEQAKATIKFTNISDGELLIKTQFNDFGAKDEEGEPNILFDDTDNSTHSLRTWIESPEPFLIQSKETKTVDFPINVPADAEPGGHYSVIRFTGTAPDIEESGVALNASVGTLVFMRVAGDVKEAASVAEFYTANGNLAKQSFFEYAPLNLVQRIKNDGNIHIKPSGTVQVKDMFGRVVSETNVNGVPGDNQNAPRSVLPNSVRRFEQEIGKNQWLFGRYEATINLTYGDNQAKKLTASTSFWVIPYTLIIFGLLGLIALFFGLRFLIRRYNDHIRNSVPHHRRRR